MNQFLKKLRVWLTKLAFWRKRTTEADSKLDTELAPIAAVDDAEPAAEQPTAKPGWLTRLKGSLTFHRRKLETSADTAEAEHEAEPVAKRKSRTQESEEPEVPEPKPGFLTRLKQWLTFRRKKTEPEAAAEAEAEPVARRKPRAKAAEEPEALEPKPGFFARLKQRLTFRGKPTETEAEPDTEAVAERKSRALESAEVETPEPKPTFLARLKRGLSFRRKPVEAEANADEPTQVIDKAKVGSDKTETEAEEDAPPPSRFKRILIRLRNKWVWIPAISLAVIGFVSWVVVIMLHTTHEKNRLQAELKAAKKTLESKTVAVVKPPAPPSPTPAAPPVKPEKKIDPAFNIVGYVPAPQSEEESGVNASDCVITDKQSVSENLKNCITSFNQAVATTPTNPKKP